MNIYHASLLAMRRAVEALPLKPEHLLIDARTIPDLSIPQSAFIKGDGINFSIAAASIIAKTYRDRLMDELDKRYPGYGFGRHKGYGTPEHQSAIRRLGPSPIHRMSYQIVRELCGECSESFYSLKRTLEAAGSRTSLGAFEETLKVRSAKLDENERRKSKTMLSRRWRTI
jgi:ribonuclease HII